MTELALSRRASPGRVLAAMVVASAWACGLGDGPERKVHEALPPIEGRVFEDLDGDGAAGPGEPGVEGVAVHRGFAVTVTGADGRFVLSGAAEFRGSSNDRFVQITRPAGFDCPDWYREVQGDRVDFGLVRRRAEPEDGFTFVQLSDAHVFDRATDFLEFSSGPRAWWMPELLRSGYLLYMTRKISEPVYTDDVAGGLRRHLAPHIGQERVDSLWDVQLAGALLEELGRDGSALSRIEPAVRAAFEELRALAPDFAISTGDLVVESNDGSEEAILRWMRFYRELTGDLGFPLYDTIGNNEIAGIGNAGFSPENPRFGKGLYQEVFGPSHFSFDRGPFHFVALDTHSRRRRSDDPRNWFFQEAENGFWDWVDRDLEHHADRIPILLNHEPFLYDPAWHFDEDDFTPVIGTGDLLTRRGVAAVLSGHIHRNGLVEEGGVTHITTGALSGFRWVLPDEVFHRGYRLFHARGGRLYSAWKRTGHPVVAFVSPPGGAEHHPASVGRSVAGDDWVVAVAADARGAFPGVRILLDGRPLSLERWGRYFVAARVPEDRRGGPGALRVEAISLDGRLLEDAARLAAGPDGDAP